MTNETRVEYKLQFYYYHHNTGSANNGWKWGERSFRTLDEAIALQTRIIANPSDPQLIDELLEGDGHFANVPAFQLWKITEQRIY